MELFAVKQSISLPTPTLREGGRFSFQLFRFQLSQRPALAAILHPLSSIPRCHCLPKFPQIFAFCDFSLTAKAETLFNP
jgi:hypothetical protein